MLAACGPLVQAHEPDRVSPATRAAQTAQVIMTRAAPAPPGPSPARESGAPATPRATCKDAARFLRDVTIQDGAQLPGGRSFVKIWRLENTGSCTWNEGYTLVFVGGDLMGARPAIPLPSAVAPGQMVEVAVDMIAPALPGEYRGYWKLRSDQGQYFGFGAGGQQAIWVHLQVSRAGAAGLAITPTGTAMVLATPATPPPPSKGPAVTLRLRAGEAVDLETIQLASAPQADLRFELLQGGASLVPLRETELSIVEGAEGSPTPDHCQASSPTNQPIALEPLAPGTAICYSTSSGAAGYLTWSIEPEALTIQISPWSP